MAEDDKKKYFGLMPALPSEFNPFDMYYSMRSPTRGFALIFYHEHYEEINGRQLQSQRVGNEKDVEKLKQTFRMLGFDIFPFKDKSNEEIKNALLEVSKNDQLKRHDCLVVVILTHGEEEEKIYARNEGYYVKQLVEPFLVKNCPCLKDKPKLFFIQACKGEKKMDVTPIEFLSDVSKFKNAYNPVANIPIDSDVLLAYSTLEGYVSYRDPYAGSPYIQMLCHELQEHGSKMDLLHILTRVHYTLSKNMHLLVEDNPQITVQPSFYCYLNRLVQFNENIKSKVRPQTI